MIITANFFNINQFIPEVDAMFLARSEIFTHRLGWVPSMNDREVDQFDTYISRPEYIICIDDITRKYLGSLRLIQMNRKNMLSEVFPHVVSEGSIPTDAGTIESSRLHMVVQGDIKRKRGINVALGELLLFLGIYAKHYGYEKLITVLDARILKIIQTVGAKPRLLGPGVMQDDGIECFVGEFTNEKDFEGVQKFFGINPEDIKIEGLI